MKSPITTLSRKPLSRRKFLKAGAISVSALSMMSHMTLRAFEKSDVKNFTSSVAGKWIPTTCQGCTAWCAIEIFVQNGRASKVRGNPNSKVNHGYVCPKGHLLVQQLYDPDRIKVPMKRTSTQKGRGIDPGFVPITWDEALDTIATKMMELRNNKETHKFLLLRGRYSPYLRNIIYYGIPKIFGSPNAISHSANCAEAEKFGPYYTEGHWSYRSYDLDATKCLVLWGTDPLSSNRQLPNIINRIYKVVDNGHLITVDPRMSPSALKSHSWLAVKPGEDGALASALAHVILTKGLWYKEFVGDFTDGVNKFVAGQTVNESAFQEKHTNGLVKWWNLELKDRTPAWAARITGIPVSKIIDAATKMAEAAPNVAVWLGPGACMSPRGGYTAMAIHALNGLLGSADNEGGTLYPPKVSTGKFPSYSSYEDEVAKTGLANKKIDQRGYLEFPAMKKGKSGGGVVTNRTAQAIIDEDPYDIKLAIGYWVNHNFSGYQTDLWDKAMAKIPFYVHITTNASEMTQFADIVLPAAFSAAEKLSVSSNMGNRYGFFSIQQPVVERLWDVRADESEIPWLLAEKLAQKGFTNLLDFYKTEFADPDSGAKPTNEKEFTEYAAKIFAKPAYDTIGGWENFKKIGIVNSAEKVFRESWGDMHTVTKKFEFYSETLKKALKAHADKHSKTIDEVLTACNYLAKGDLAFVPHYEPPLRIGSKGLYPFDFVDYKSRLNREGRSQNTNWYNELKLVDPGDSRWEDVLKINPTDAKNLGIKDGDTVTVKSPVTQFTVVARVWPGIPPGVVTKCYGQGHWAYGKVAAKDYKKAVPRGKNNNDFIPEEYERLSGSSARNGGFFGVDIQKVTSVKPEQTPVDFDLGLVYPNPTTADQAHVSVYTSTAATVTIELYNSIGVRIRRISQARYDAGTHIVNIDLNSVPPGTYFCKMISGDFVKTQKFTVTR